MTKAILLSAGQGKRLAPLTDNRPKCLLPIGASSILEIQLRALYTAGIRDVTVVTGFESHSVDAAIKLSALPMNVRTCLNPFYSVADNIGSCWMVKDVIEQGAVLINGDTLFDPRILKRVLETATAPISVTIDTKGTYDADDMKVSLQGETLTRIAKTLTEGVDGESIGMLRFTPEGGALFVSEMERMLRKSEALKLWYLSIIDSIAKTGAVGTVSITGLPWAEVDFPSDVPTATSRVASFDWDSIARDAVDAGTVAQREIGS